jgi:L-asparaginase
MTLAYSTSHHVAVLTTGGTIASTFDGATGSVTTRLGVEALLDELPKAGLPPVMGRNVLARNSYALTLDDALAILRAIDAERACRDVAGVVVTHGTDTLEETAFLVDLLLEPGKPVVFTGAQASADEPDRDGPRNLADAIRIAGDRNARGLGVLVAFDGDIFPARDATKRHTSRRQAFGATMGPVGTVDTGIVRIVRRPARFPRFGTARLAEPVDLITLTLGGGERLLQLAAEAGARGIVLAATGRGNATPPIVSLVGELTRNGVPVLVTSRSPEGRVEPIYGQGGGADLEKAGAIFAGDLSGPKARLLLSVILGQPDAGDVASLVRSVANACIEEKD